MQTFSTPDSTEDLLHRYIANSALRTLKLSQRLLRVAFFHSVWVQHACNPGAVSELSGKFAALMALLQTVADHNTRSGDRDKVVVVSEWTATLDVIQVRCLLSLRPASTLASRGQIRHVDDSRTR